MTDTGKQWLTTRDVAIRWDCCVRTVQNRMRAAEAAGLPAQFSEWGQAHHWTIDQVRAVERWKGIEGMFD